MPTPRPPSSPFTAVAAAKCDNPFLGFTALSLPVSSPTASQLPLRRTTSEPIYSAIPPCSISGQPIHVSPNTNKVQESSAFPTPPPPPVIYRTISDPNPVSNHHVTAACSHSPHPQLERKFSRSPSSGESPNAKRVKRMKERLSEISQWCNQVVVEGNEEDVVTEDYQCDDIPKASELSENEQERPSQEAVWVDKNGDYLVLHFKCPCGSGYEILLNGNNCYYKLTSF